MTPTPAQRAVSVLQRIRQKRWMALSTLNKEEDEALRTLIAGHIRAAIEDERKACIEAIRGARVMIEEQCEFGCEAATNLRRAAIAAVDARGGV